MQRKSRIAKAFFMPIKKCLVTCNRAIPLAPSSPLPLHGRTHVRRQWRFWPCRHSRNLTVASSTDLEQWMQQRAKRKREKIRERASESSNCRLLTSYCKRTNCTEISFDSVPTLLSLDLKCADGDAEQVHWDTPLKQTR